MTHSERREEGIGISRLKRPAWCLLAFWIAGVSGCSRLENSAALKPYLYAPPARNEQWQSIGTPLPLGGMDTNTTGSLSSSNWATVSSLTDWGLSRPPDKTNDLADLIDLAQRANPQTREAWEQARAAAARLGLADSAYAPVLALVAAGGYSYSGYPAPGGLLVASGPSVNPGLSLEWMLLDFGRRRADFDAAAQQLLQANFHFNRTHQQVAYEVQRSFYAYDSSRAQLDAALATLQAAQTVEQAASLRLDHGLATRSEHLQTQQERARAQYDLQSAQRNVSDAWALLAESLGVSPALSFNAVDLSALPIPTNLADTVELAVDRALRQRPDLAAQLASLRAREAEVRRARAEFRPSLGLSATGGGTAGSWHVTAAGAAPSTFGYADTEYGAFLTFSWSLFDGFMRRNKLREAEARRNEAEAALTALELKALREVWQAYADCKASFLQYDFAVALLTASQDNYDAALTSYQHGLGTVIELLTAERDLARARTTLVESRAGILTASAALAFAAGDWTGAPSRQASSATQKER